MSVDTQAPESAARLRSLLLQRVARARSGAPDVPSPCVSVCRMNADRGFCEGCFRSIDEIRVWSRADDAQKRIIWERLLLRAG
ncbi:DUF1289 domain-containing protein [Xylophilus sp. ASV27]|uniref:DUF1289 domain-containing protein n=1 Tax=Xylophilus sp. ASV27 TaxID=2795129 RepID=UPI0018EB140E|nr:DUF1289 domain-containing protein [Xylophilus sp. ASV27]